MTWRPGGTIQLNDRAHTENVLRDLAKLAREMTAVRAPRSVILVSGGLDLNQELMAHYKELQRAAAESRVVLYTVLLEEVGYEVERGIKRPEIGRPPGLVESVPSKADGLATIGSMTGGMFFNAAGSAGGIFDRIQSEVTSFYQLAIESSPADADGKERDVKVRVNRTGVDVRAPAHVAVSKPPKTAPLRDRLAEALRQPTDVPDVPLAVTTYSTHGAAGPIQVLLAAEIGAPNAAAPVEWGYAVNRPAKTTRQAGQDSGGLGASADDFDQPWSCSQATTAFAWPRSMPKIASAFSTLPFTAGYQTVAATMMSDLVVGVVAGGQFEPRRRLAGSEEITATLQVVGGIRHRHRRRPAADSRRQRAFRSQRAVFDPTVTIGGCADDLTGAGVSGLGPTRPLHGERGPEIDGQPSTRIDRVIEVTGRRLPPRRSKLWLRRSARRPQPPLRPPLVRRARSPVSRFIGRDHPPCRRRTWRVTEGRRRCSSESSTIRSREPPSSQRREHRCNRSPDRAAGASISNVRGAAAAARVRVRAHAEHVGERRLARIP